MSIAACVKDEAEAGGFPDLLPIPDIVPPACTRPHPGARVQGEAEAGGFPDFSDIAPPAAQRRDGAAQRLLERRHAALGFPLAPWTYREFYDLLGDDLAHLRANDLDDDDPLMRRLDRLGHFVLQLQRAPPMIEAVMRLCAQVHAGGLGWFHLSESCAFEPDACGNDIMASLRDYVGLGEYRPATFHPAFVTTEGVPTNKRGRPRKRASAPKPEAEAEAARPRKRASAPKPEAEQVIGRPLAPQSPPPIRRPMRAADARRRCAHL